MPPSSFFSLTSSPSLSNTLVWKVVVFMKIRTKSSFQICYWDCNGMLCTWANSARDFNVCLKTERMVQWLEHLGFAFKVRYLLMYVAEPGPLTPPTHPIDISGSFIPGSNKKYKLMRHSVGQRAGLCPKNGGKNGGV